MVRYEHKGLLTDRLVDKSGNIYELDGAPSKLHDNGNGYLLNIFRYNLEGKVIAGREYIHRIVARTFLEQPDGATQVNHKDGDKNNNSVDNLEWVTPSSNIRHAHKAGLMKNRTENAKTVVLTEAEVIDCYSSVKFKGEKINDVAKRMNKPRTTISSIINKRSRWDITNRLDKEAQLPTVAQKQQQQDLNNK